MTDMPANRPAIGRARLLPILLIAAVAVAGAVFLRGELSYEALSEHRGALLAIRDSQPLLTAIGFILGYILIVGFSLPGATVATLAGGFLFGLFPGALFNVVAATLGATMIFLAARWGMGQRLAARLDASEGALKRIKTGIDHNQWEMLFFIRLVPVIPFFAANLLPALVGVPLVRFMVTTFFGIMPGALVYTSVGAGLGEVFERGEAPDLDIILEPYILLPLLGLALLALLPAAIRKLRAKEGGHEQG